MKGMRDTPRLSQMRVLLRRARYGYRLAFHIVLLCAAGRNPTEIVAFLFGSRSSAYRIVRAYRTGSLGIHVAPDGQLSPDFLHCVHEIVKSDSLAIGRRRHHAQQELIHVKTLCTRCLDPAPRRQDDGEGTLL